jgi:hypothetical protein
MGSFTYVIIYSLCTDKKKCGECILYAYYKILEGLVAKLYLRKLFFLYVEKGNCSGKWFDFYFL